jgi:hypothetical protein
VRSVALRRVSNREALELRQTPGPASFETRLRRSSG